MGFIPFTMSHQLHKQTKRNIYAIGLGLFI
jgi:hypothetical protein